LKGKIYILLIFFSGWAFASLAQQKALQTESLKDSASLLKEKGIKMASRGEMEKAKDLFFRELKIKQRIYNQNNPEIGHTYVNIGVIFKKEGNYKAALDYYQKAEEIYQNNSSTSSAKAGTNYSNMANVYTRQKDYKKAERYYNKALNLFLTDSMKNSALIAMAYNNYGIVQKSLNQYEKAIFSYKISYDIYKSLNSKSVVLPLGNLAIIYTNQNRYKKAEKYFKETLAYYKKYYGETYIGLVNDYMNYGILKLKQNKFTKAEEQFKKALFINKKHFQGSHPRTARCYNNLGTLYARQKKYKKALTFYQKSLNNLAQNFSDTSIYSNPKISDVSSSVELIKALKNKAFALNTFPDKKEDHKKLALETIGIATKAIEDLRKGYLSQESKLFITSHEKETYGQGLNIAYDLFSRNKKMEYLNEAFQYSENGKSAVLYENLQTTKARQVGNIPDELKKEENLLKKKIWTYEELIFEEQKKQEPDNKKIDFWKDKIFKYNKRLEELTNIFEKKYPKYYSLKYEDNDISITEIQSGIKKNNALIEFSIVKNNIFLFYIEKDTAIIKKIKKDSATVKKIHSLRNFLTERNFSSHSKQDFIKYTENANDIYNKLFSFLPIEKVNSITIIPDGILSYIPFEILITQKPRENSINYHNINYLIRNLNITYSYSAQVLFSQKERKYDQNKLLAAFAPIYNNIENLSADKNLTRQEYREKLYPLKGISKEVHAIAPLFNGDIYEGKEANEQNFKEKARKYKILHLAMHTLINDENPMYSKMAFTQSKGAVEDGFLNTYEIYNLELNSKLAVLSSCNTGAGKIHKGEGVISLARGFKYAGCPSIVMTLWPVEDNSSINLMKYFYQELKKGRNKPEALRKAKLKYLEEADPLHAHPYFWSGYIVIGDKSPVFKSIYERALVYILPGILLVILSYFIYKKIRKKRIAEK
jgi:CHAT domain-containing protein/Tfp pilus assembly protein PilF